MKKALTWEEYFMNVSLLSSLRSKDPSTKVGACIVKDNIIQGVGYNGFPNGCSDEEYPWDRTGDFLDMKYAYVVHAELNAILNSQGRNLKGSTIYVTYYPCCECAKAIIQSGIKEVVYLDGNRKHNESEKASCRMFTDAGINLRKMKLVNNVINLEE